MAQARGNMFYLIVSREVNVDRSSMSIQASQGYTETSVVLLIWTNYVVPHIILKLR